MITWTKVVQNALYKMAHRQQYCYLYGAKGQVINSREKFEAIWNAEPTYFSRYTEDEKEQIFRNSYLRIAYDCSGFTGACTGDMTYSAGQATHCEKNESPDLGPCASFLYTTFGGTGRHCALDIGFGYFINMSGESTDAQVARGKDSIWIGKISDYNWEFSGKSKFIDYEGATNR